MTLLSREGTEARFIQEIDQCPQCEGQRVPRMWICPYHEGWMDGYDAAWKMREQM